MAAPKRKPALKAPSKSAAREAASESLHKRLDKADRLMSYAEMLEDGDLMVALTTGVPSELVEYSSESADGLTWTSGGLSTSSRWVMAPGTVFTTDSTSTPVITTTHPGLDIRWSPDPGDDLEEVDLAVMCFKVRFLTGRKKPYTYAAIGIKVDEDSNERRWFLTGNARGTPQGATYEELLDWMSQDDREILDVWLATSWHRLTEREEVVDE